MTPPDTTSLFAEVRALLYAAVLQTLSTQLTEEFGRGFSVDNLTAMRRLTVAYRDRLPISETPSRISVSPTPPIRPFALSWSHYAFLIGVKDDAAKVADSLMSASDLYGYADKGMLPRAFLSVFNKFSPVYGV